jgi:hypothetical protein
MLNLNTLQPAEVLVEEDNWVRDDPQWLNDALRMLDNAGQPGINESNIADYPNSLPRLSGQEQLRRLAVLVVQHPSFSPAFNAAVVAKLKGGKQAPPQPEARVKDRFEIAREAKQDALLGQLTGSVIHHPSYSLAFDAAVETAIDNLVGKVKRDGEICG